MIFFPLEFRADSFTSTSNTSLKEIFISKYLKIEIQKQRIILSASSKCISYFKETKQYEMATTIAKMPTQKNNDEEEKQSDKFMRSEQKMKRK